MPYQNADLRQSVVAYILRKTKFEQLTLVLLSLAILPVIYIVLEIPKHIVNHALGAGDLDAEFVAVEFFGLVLEQEAFLISLCFAFIAFIVVQALLKYCLNLSKGKLSEQHLSLLRKRLLHVCVEREQHNNAKLIPMIVRELEVVAGFFGDVLVLPVFQLGSFLTILLFLFVQNPVLGLVAISLLPVQMIVVPMMQRKINALNQERLSEVGGLSEKVGQINMRSIGAAYTSVEKLRNIRIAMYRQKFLMKALYNFSMHLVPFFFYSVGGYLVLNDGLTFGALIAALAAYKDLSSPLKELFKYYQTAQDVKVRWVALQKVL